MSERDPRTNPREGDVWESSDGLVIIRVLNGRWRGDVIYARTFVSDPPKTMACPPRKWAGVIAGKKFKGGNG